ncbi:MAG: helix-turn-helix domain-containing protein [Candidatus Omnitrophica bacterium]|nr:helix-turn-helix domain-containing protein [Candidatus Omnitrophota bacterium]
MDSIGARLKKARLEKKFTIDEVYKKTKIHPNVLQAIEEDRFSQLSPVYLKSFLKLYAKFLGVDPQEVVEGYQETKTVVEKAEEIKEKEPQSQPQEKSRPSLPVAAVNPVIVKPLAVKSAIVEKEEPPFKFDFAVLKPYLKVVGLILAAIIALWLLLKVAKFTVGRVKAVAHAITTRPKKAAKPEEKNQAKAKPVVKPVVKPEVKPLVKPVTAKPVSSMVELSIRAKEDCYIHLKSDGKTVFQSVLKKGYAEAWAAKNKMELTVGNAGGIDLNVNGNPLPALGKRKQAIKNIIITKEGLSTP